MNVCRAPGCGVEIDRKRFFCRFHWFQLTGTRRMQVSRLAWDGKEDPTIIKECIAWLELLNKSTPNPRKG